MGCTLSKVSPQPILDTENVTKTRIRKRRARKVIKLSKCVDSVKEEDNTARNIDPAAVVKDIGDNDDEMAYDDDEQLGIYNDDGGDELYDEDAWKTSTNFRRIQVRPMAAKGERMSQKSQMAFHSHQIDEDIETLISVYAPSTANPKDRRFRPKAAKGSNTPSWLSADRYLPPALPSRKRAANLKSTFQAECLDRWMRSQMAKENTN